MELLQNLNRERGTTVILITHDPKISEQAQRIIQLKDGLLVENGA